MAAGFRELVDEIYELRVLIAAWDHYSDPELREVLRQMRLQVRRNLFLLAAMIGEERTRHPQLH